MLAPRPFLSALAALAVAATGCFRDDAPALECSGGSVGSCAPLTTTSGDASSGTTTGAAETTAEPTTAAPPDPRRAFRIDALEIVDPHLFLDTCADATEFVNTFLVQNNIDNGEFNLLIYFPSYDPNAPEPGLIEADDCDLAAGTCVRKDGLSLTVSAERVDAGACVTLDPAVLAAPNVPLVGAPQPPCVRTAKAELVLPIEGAAVPLNLRDAQVVFTVDDFAEPQALQHGVVYGFLTRVSAEATTIEVNKVPFELWSLITGPADCAMEFPSYLPSVETLVDDDRAIEGVWMVFNFTATRVELVDAL